jgi:hypothetical protein
MPYFRIRQNNATVAIASGKDAEREIMHHADLYRAYGPVTIQRQERSPTLDGKWYWKRHMLMEKWPIKTAVQ